MHFNCLSHLSWIWKVNSNNNNLLFYWILYTSWFTYVHGPYHWCHCYQTPSMHNRVELKVITPTSVAMMSRFGKLKVLIARSDLLGPLDFELMRVDCVYYQKVGIFLIIRKFLNNLFFFLTNVFLVLFAFHITVKLPCYHRRYPSWQWIVWPQTSVWVSFLVYVSLWPCQNFCWWPGSPLLQEPVNKKYFS